MIYDILLVGEENAQTGKEICKLLDISPRELTAAIERERRAGKPICASNGSSPGYFIAPDRETMELYCRRLELREREIAKTRLACAATLPELPQSLPLQK